MSQVARTASQPDVSFYRFKPWFVLVLEPIRRLLEERGVSPTMVTMAAIPVEVAVALLLVAGTNESWLLTLVPVFALCWMGLNALDGSLARSTGRITVRGAVLNELVDRLGDVLLIAAAAFVVPVPLAAGLAISVLGSELVAAVGWATTGRRDFAGPMGKPDRAAVIAVGAMVAVVWPDALIAAMALIAIGSAIGVGVRGHSVLSRARSLDAGDRR